jgi:CheY-like chemotaxis protein
MAGHELSEEEVRAFCDAWEGRASGWARPTTKNAAMTAGWDAAEEAMRRGPLRGGDVLQALEAWRAKRLAVQAPPSQHVEYAPPRGHEGEHASAKRAGRAKVVLCLEDTESRIVWLRDVARHYGATVHATARVKEFLLLCQNHAVADVKAIVLDHDLGGFSMPVSLQDPDGLDGLDAAERIPATVSHAPVLVWSSNDEEAPRMAQILRGRGFLTVARMPWYGERSDIAAKLHDWLSW